MTDEERRDVDEAALRLLGFKQNEALPSLWFGPWCSVTVGKDGPTQNESLVVPLAEALRKRDLYVKIEAEPDGWVVMLLNVKDAVVSEEACSSLPLALAVAAARAVREGTSPG